MAQVFAAELRINVPENNNFETQQEETDDDTQQASEMMMKIMIVMKNTLIQFKNGVSVEKCRKACII